MRMVEQSHELSHACLAPGWSKAQQQNTVCEEAEASQASVVSVKHRTTTVSLYQPHPLIHGSLVITLVLWGENDGKILWQRSDGLCCCLSQRRRMLKCHGSVLCFSVNLITPFTTGNQGPSLSLICILKYPHQYQHEKTAVPPSCICRIWYSRTNHIWLQSHLHFSKSITFIFKILHFERTRIWPDFADKVVGLAALSSLQQQHLFVKICTSTKLAWNIPGNSCA